MKKLWKSAIAFAAVTAFVITAVFLPGPVSAGDLDPSAGPDDPGSAMYTIEDIYNYLYTGVAGTKRTGGFVEPTSSPGSTGHTLDDVHEKIGERCITCDGTLSTEGRWCDNENGTVTDMTTGLVWLKNAGCMGWMGWYDAIKKPIEDLRDSDCGLTDGSVWGDWRLPTISELSGITQGNEAVSSSNMQFFTGVQSPYYWSSTTYAGHTYYAWNVDLSNGGVGGDDKGGNGYVWPVRADN